MSTLKFEWDEKNNVANPRKRGVSLVLVVCHCYRQSGEIIRIISTRKTDRGEIEQYHWWLRARSNLSRVPSSASIPVCHSPTSIKAA
jgi:hypothetical protein